MGRPLKCYGTCGSKYPIEELEKYKGKNYCKNCLGAVIERDKDYYDLCGYICEIFGCDYVNPYIKKQIGDYEKGGFTLKGMRSTLWYINNVLKVKLREECGIGMVRYKYYEAKKYSKERGTQKLQARRKQKQEVDVKYVNMDRFRTNKPKKKFNLEDINIEGE